MDILDIHTITKTFHELAPRYGVDKAYLFGSYARGDADECSDVDICIDAHSPTFSLFSLGGLGAHLEERLSRNVDIICGEESFYPKALKRYQDDKVLLYEKH